MAGFYSIGTIAVSLACVNVALAHVPPLDTGRPCQHVGKPRTQARHRPHYLFASLRHIGHRLHRQLYGRGAARAPLLLVGVRGNGLGLGHGVVVHRVTLHVG